MADNPIRHLLARHQRRRPPLWAAPLIFGLPAILIGLLWPDGFLGYLCIAPLLLSVGLVWMHLESTLGFLVGLRRGRALEEVMAVGLPPSLVADTLAGWSLGPAAQLTLPLAVLLTLVVHNSLPLMWLLSTLLATVVTSYLGQLLTWKPYRWLDWLVLLLPTTAAWYVAWVVRQGPIGLVLLGLLAGLGWLTLAARQLVLLRLRSTARPPSPRRKLRLAGWNDNLIVMRERARGVTLGWLSALWPALPLSWPGLDEGWRWLALTALLLLCFLRAASRTLNAVLAEKQGRCWDVLVQTGLAQHEFVSGWLQVAVYPVALELLPVSLALLAATLWVPLFSSVGLFWLLCLGLALMLALTGAWVGLSLSASCRDRREAGLRLILEAAWGMALALLGGAALSLLELDWWPLWSVGWLAALCLVRCLLASYRLRGLLTGAGKHRGSDWYLLALPGMAGGLVLAGGDLLLTLGLAATGACVSALLGWTLGDLARRPVLGLALGACAMAAMPLLLVPVATLLIVQELPGCHVAARFLTTLHSPTGAAAAFLAGTLSGLLCAYVRSSGSGVARGGLTWRALAVVAVLTAPGLVIWGFAEATPEPALGPVVRQRVSEQAPAWSCPYDDAGPSAALSNLNLWYRSGKQPLRIRLDPRARERLVSSIRTACERGATFSRWGYDAAVTPLTGLAVWQTGEGRPGEGVQTAILALRVATSSQLPEEMPSLIKDLAAVLRHADASALGVALNSLRTDGLVRDLDEEYAQAYRLDLDYPSKTLPGWGLRWHRTMLTIRWLEARKKAARLEEPTSEVGDLSCYGQNLATRIRSQRERVRSLEALRLYLEQRLHQLAPGSLAPGRSLSPDALQATVSGNEVAVRFGDKILLQEELTLSLETRP